MTRRKLAPSPLVRPIDVGLAARPLAPAQSVVGLPTAAMLQHALKASLVVSMALAVAVPIVGCREEVPEIHPERMVVIPKATASSTNTDVEAKPGTGSLETIVEPKPYDEVVVTKKPVPRPIKHHPVPSPTSPPMPGGMKAPMIITPTPSPTTAATLKPYAPPTTSPLVPKPNPPKLSGDPMKTHPGSI